MTRRTSPLHAVLLALVLGGSLTACSGDDREDDDDAPVAATAPASSSVAPSPQAEPSSVVSPTEPTATVPFPANTAVDEQDPAGGLLTVRTVRVARQDGYDRVVFELGGAADGQPGWRVEYSDDPRQQGSGDPVEVDGEHVLSVLITGTGYPFDTGVDEVEGDPALPADLQVVEDVDLGAVFEGQYEAFLGTSVEAPFRVFRLSDPARVVVDVRTS